MLHGWPGYQAKDLVRLALLSARGGQPDAATGWPLADSLQPYYAEHFSPPGRIVALPDDLGVLVGDVAALADVAGDADVVISLCRVGNTDVPGGLEHHEVWLLDSEDEGANPNLDFVFRDTAEAIATYRDEGKRVFVHCVHAQARTPAVAAAYLAHRFGMSGAEAATSMRSLLPGSLRRRSFASALERLWPAIGAGFPTQDVR
jgi:ADP-ribosyl-[dinitrogen reductase] hydrolase